jgi:hypothetical protein
MTISLMKIGTFRINFEIRPLVGPVCRSPASGILVTKPVLSCSRNGLRFEGPEDKR